MLKKELIHLALKQWKKNGFCVRYWDGSEKNYGKTAPLFTIVFTKEPTISSDALRGAVDLWLGELYAEGTLELEGNLDDAVATFFEKDPAKIPFPMDTLRKQMMQKEALEQKDVQSHYDLGNEFFSRWLDPTMSYSCAYFEHENDTLEQAQRQKIDHSLKKLDLHQGEHLLDIGCGWGEVILTAAKTYGVHATGITLSEEQYQLTKERIQKEGLSDLVEVRLENYLDIDPSKELYDKIISIGMMEHVGKPYLPLYIAKVSSLLKPGGLFMLHSIMNFYADESERKNWLSTYIFPGGYVPGMAEVTSIFPYFDLRMVHMESLRLHYARTLELWDKNYEAIRDTLPPKYDERFKRIWSLYLKGCAAGFRTGLLDIVQFLLSKGVNNNLPINNSYMYKEN